MDLGPRESIVLVDDFEALLFTTVKRGFWFGCFGDPDGNASWVVDGNCP